MDTQRLYQLLELYAARNASPTEESELFALIEEGEEGELKAQLFRLQETAGPAGDFDQARWQPVLHRILSVARTLEEEEEEEEKTPFPEGPQTVPMETGLLNPRRIFPWGRVAAAAIFLVLGAGTWYFIHRQPAAAIADRSARVVRDIAPGGNKAILTLSDGSHIVLDSAADGSLAQQGNTRLIKLGSGSLAYKPGAPNGEVFYNTVTTPKGGQYRITLPDSTRVWLNAASSLTFPVAFTGKERTVSISGEVYFEVARNRQSPFKVKVNKETEINVLGTSFNVNAYSDEACISTTLIEGSVKVVRKMNARTLTPGQQAQVLDKTADIKLIPDANVNQVIAWKDGVFSFANADLPAVMRELARWYNLDVQYQGAVPKAEFTGEIDKSLSLSQVLKGLSRTRINYRIEQGNKLIILP